MKKEFLGLLMISVVFTLSSCSFVLSSERQDFRNCVKDECEQDEANRVTRTFLDDIFSGKYDDLEINDDFTVSTELKTYDESYTVVVSYLDDNLRYYTAVTSTLDLYYNLEDIDEELSSLNTGKEPTVILVLEGSDANLDIKMSVVKEVGSKAQLYLELVDLDSSYDFVLNEVFGYLGSFELLMEFEPISVNISVATNQGVFYLDCVDESFEYELRFLPNIHETDTEALPGEFLALIENEMREEYTATSIE